MIGNQNTASKKKGDTMVPKEYHACQPMSCAVDSIWFLSDLLLNYILPAEQLL